MSEMVVKKSKKKEVKEDANNEPEDVGQRLTLATLDAISDEDSEDVGEEEWNAEARALRQAIADGAFDSLTNKLKTAEEEEVQEVELEDDDSDADESSSEGSAKADQEPTVNNSKALLSVTEELTAAKRGMPWVESFDVIPSTPLPFGSAPLDAHDDLKREVAFYNVALEAVHDARTRCQDIGVPFSRPEDFFAEMVKTDDHMAKVKDRLIFETKKMDAFAQRKSNREHKLRAKEAHAHKLAEKAKHKKDHFRAVDEWAKSAAASRGGPMREDDDANLGKMRGPNKKRMAADKKYGYGGKRGRFKQTDKKTLNDMSSFNPRGNFSGMGSKRESGSKRKGKRARDATRARR